MLHLLGLEALPTVKSVTQQNVLLHGNVFVTLGRKPLVTYATCVCVNFGTNQMLINNTFGPFI